MLALGGVATVLVAANPLPAGGGSSAAHTASAAGGVRRAGLLAGARLAPRADGPPSSWASAPSLAAAAVLLAAVLWFAVELSAGAGRVGLAERCAAGLQALWPLAVVLALRRRRPASGSA